MQKLHKLPNMIHPRFSIFTFFRKRVLAINIKKIVLHLQISTLIFAFTTFILEAGQYGTVSAAAIYNASATYDIDVTEFKQIKDAVEGAGVGDVLNFYIKDDIIFNSAVLIKQSVSIKLVNDSGNSDIKLKIADGGVYRHFSTGSANNSSTDIAGVAMTIGTGVILDGGGTGGGINMCSSGGYMELSGCTIINCKSPTSVNGGGINIAGISERAMLVMEKVCIKNCISSSGGGGIFGNGSDIYFNSGLITENGSMTGMGSGICIMAGSNKKGSTLTVNGGEISHNAQPTGGYSDGGGLWAWDTVVTIKGGEISYNTATGIGGGIFMRETTTADHPPAKLIIDGGTIKGNKTGNYGGGIGLFSPITEFTINGGLITENESTTQGGGIYVNSENVLTMNGGTVTRNKAGTGGGIFVNFSTLAVKGTAEISENESTTSAGGIYGYQGCTITIDGNAKITGNKAFCSNAPENDMRGGGGIALLSYGHVSTLTIKGNALISGNSALSYGGGIWTYPTYGPAPVVRIEGGTIEKNSANYGGGISMGEIDQYVPVLTITGGKITQNTASKNGGGIIAKSSAVSITNCTIADNATDVGHGGGIYVAGNSTLTINGANAITGNSAKNGNGGGIYTEDTSYANLDIGIQTFFIGNKASMAYAPPDHAASLYPNIQFASISIADHPLNNYDINYESERPLLFHVTYDANGGVGSYAGPDVAPGEFDTVLSLKDTGITRENYYFTSWNTQPDGSGTSYALGDKVILNSNVTLFAMWTEIITPIEPQIPQTGDHGGMTLWMYGCFLSVIVLCMFDMAYKKRRGIK